MFLSVVMVWTPLLTSSHVDNGLSDWSYRADYVAYGLNSLLHDHQFPFWVTGPRFTQYRIPNAHEFFANPETDVLSIVTPLAAIWGVLTAVKVSLVLYLGLGVWGCRRLLILLGDAAGAIPLLLASLLALCNGGFVAHIMVGHTQFMATATFPLILALILESFEAAALASTRYFKASLAGALFASAYYSGAVHPLTYALPSFLVFVPLFTILVSPSRFRVVLPAAAVACISFAVLAAFKLLPGVMDFSGYRSDYHDVYEGWDAFAIELVTPWMPTGHSYHHETTLYVGWLGAGILAFAILGVRDRRSIPLLLTCAAIAVPMFFKNEHLLALPFIGAQGALRRIRLVIMPMVAVVAATQIRRAWGPRNPRRALQLASLAVAATLSIVFAFDLARTNGLRHGLMSSHDVLPAVKGPFDGAPELVPVNAREARVYVGNVRANSFDYEVTTASAAPVVLRAPELLATPHLPHLTLEGDGELFVKDGALAVRVAGPRARFTLRFRDPLVPWACGISLCGVAGLIALGIAARRAKRDAMGSFEVG